ncbi:hypothetical protein Tco_1489225 [Tanacetum coccineum]
MAGGHAFHRDKEIHEEDSKESESKWQRRCWPRYDKGGILQLPQERAPRNQGNRNRDNARRVVLVETSANALVIQDGIGSYDWSFQDEDGPIKFALMAYTSQGSSSSSMLGIQFLVK